MRLAKFEMSLLVALALLPVASLAADSSASENASVANPWSGWHVGVNAGLIQTRQTFSTAPGGTLLSVPFLGSRDWGRDQTEVSGSKFLAGLQGGYNWALDDKIVLGVEADLQLNDQSSNKVNAFNPAGSAATTIVTNSTSSKTPWLSTLRGRIGYLPEPNLMIYGTAGLAYGQEKGKFTSSVSSGSTLVEVFPYDISKRALGYALGGGCEWAVNRNWSFKADYTYIRLSTNTNQTIPTAYLGPAALSTDVVTLSTSKEQINLIRLGLNYSF
jgi:outer membrane immunogenic protein